MRCMKYLLDNLEYYFCFTIIRNNPLNLLFSRILVDNFNNRDKYIVARMLYHYKDN
jgi:hypothetical protein